MSTVPVAGLKQEMVHAVEKKFPCATITDLTKCVSCKDVTFRNGMIVVYGSTSGLPDFGQILQICVVQEILCNH